MRIFTLTLLMSLVGFGICIFIYGGYDDSPGAQGIGAALIILGAVRLYKSFNRH